MRSAEVAGVDVFYRHEYATGNVDPDRYLTRTLSRPCEACLDERIRASESPPPSSQNRCRPRLSLPCHCRATTTGTGRFSWGNGGQVWLLRDQPKHGNALISLSWLIALTRQRSGVRDPQRPHVCCQSTTFALVGAVSCVRSPVRSLDRSLRHGDGFRSSPAASFCGLRRGLVEGRSHAPSRPRPGAHADPRPIQSSM